MSMLSRFLKLVALLVLTATIWLSVGASYSSPTSSETARHGLVSDPVLSHDRTIRGEALTARLVKLRPGMSKRDVELVLGPPDDEMYVRADGTGRVLYLWDYPKTHPTPGAFFISIPYSLKTPTPRLLTVPEKPQQLGCG